MKISDNLKSSYWFNFLAICGWVSFIAFIIFASPDFYHDIFLSGTPRAISIGIKFFLYSIFVFICLLISFFIYVAEQIFSFKIKNENFIKNKIIIIFQILGTIFALTPILLMFYLFLTILADIIVSRLHF